MGAKKKCVCVHCGIFINFFYLFDLSIFTPSSPPFSGGHSSCEFDECGPSPASNLVSLFSAQQDVWLDLFTVAYDKMTSTLADGVDKNLKRPAKE